MRIVEMRVTPIALIDPPLRSAFGLHAPYALQTILELVTDDGLVGISETHGGTAVAAALADRCQACNVVFRPQFSYQVRRNENIMTCESCGLILYYEPPGAGLEDPAGDAGIVSG